MSIVYLQDICCCHNTLNQSSVIFIDMKISPLAVSLVIQRTTLKPAPNVDITSSTTKRGRWPLGKQFPIKKAAFSRSNCMFFMHSFVRISVGFNQPVLFWSSWASKNRLSRMESIRGKSDLVKRVVSRGSKQVS